MVGQAAQEAAISNTSSVARRIVILTGIFAPDIGGPATHARDLVDGLQKLGREAIVLTLTDAHAMVREPGVVRLPRRWRWPLWSIAAIVWLVKNRRRYDAVYATGLYLPAGIGARLARRPVIMKIAGDPAWERSRRLGLTALDFDAFQDQPPATIRIRLMCAARNLSMRTADRTIAPSRHLANAVDRWLGSSGSTAVVPNAVSPNEVSPNAGSVGEPNTTTGAWSGKAIWIGRLVAHKEVEKLLDALATIPSVTLEIVGDGPERLSLERAAERLGISDRVAFAGRQTHDEAMRRLARSDVLLNASSWEGLPHVALEALCLGVPVVASASGGTSEAVRSQVNGLLIDPSTAEGFADALRKLESDPELFASLRRGALNSADAFRMDALTEKIATLSDRALQADPLPFVAFVSATAFGEPDENARLAIIGRHLTATVLTRGRGRRVTDSGVAVVGVTSRMPKGLRVLTYYVRAPLLGLAYAARRRGALVVQSPYEAVAPIVATRLLPRRLRPLLVVEVHGDWRTATRLYGSNARRLLAPIADRLASWAIRRADRVRVVSTFTESLAREAGYQGSIDRYITYSDYRTFLSTPTRPLPDVPRVLFVGALQRCKGLEALLNSWQSVQGAGRRAELMIVGSGPLRAALERQAAVLGVSGSVRFAGQVSRDVLCELLDTSSFLVLPSESEGLPRVLLEAAARERAAVASRVGGIPEVVEDGVTGLLIPSGDVPELAKAMTSLLSDPRRAEEMGKRARVVLADHLDLHDEWERGIAGLAETVGSVKAR